MLLWFSFTQAEVILIFHSELCELEPSLTSKCLWEETGRGQIAWLEERQLLTPKLKSKEYELHCVKSSSLLGDWPEDCRQRVSGGFACISWGLGMKMTGRRLPIHRPASSSHSSPAISLEFSLPNVSILLSV